MTRDERQHQGCSRRREEKSCDWGAAMPQRHSDQEGSWRDDDVGDATRRRGRQPPGRDANKRTDRADTQRSHSDTMELRSERMIGKHH